MLAMIAPHQLHVFGETKKCEALVTAAYRQNRAADAISFSDADDLQTAILKRVGE